MLGRTDDANGRHRSCRSIVTKLFWVLYHPILDSGADLWDLMGVVNHHRLMTITTSQYVLSWDCYSQWMPEDTEIGGIYTDCVHFDAIGDYHFAVSFRIGEGRTLGILFCEVTVTEPDSYVTKRHYAFGQFYTNKGAKLFAQFALNHFIETETWSVCPSFEPVDYLDGDPYTLTGDEIVSDI